MLQGEQQIADIDRSSTLFRLIEYTLKINLKSIQARLLSLKKITNQNLISQHTRSILNLTTFIDIDRLSGENTQESIIKDGFRLGKGMAFDMSDYKPRQGLNEALICDIAVGRSFFVDSNNEHLIPSGYDSLYLSDSITDAKQEYFINENNQILPLYLIQFEYDPELEIAALQKPKCDDCEVVEAIVYCDADKAYLCKHCDAELHKTKIAKQHYRQPIGQGVDVFGNCKLHTTRQIQYFCSQCHEPICIDCTILGSHAKLDGHTLVPVQEYFKTILQDIEIENPQIQERRVAISKQRGNIQSRADAVIQMGKETTSQIDTICSKAKEQCKLIIENKLTVLLGDENELKRQDSEIVKLEEFLKYQLKGDSMQCVYTWHLHQMLREQLIDFKFFRQDIDVHLDAKIDGSIAVVIDKAKTNIKTSSTYGSPTRRDYSNIRQDYDMLSNTNDSYTIPDAFDRSVRLVNSQRHIIPSNSNYESPPRIESMSMLKSPTKYAKTTDRKVERRTSDFFHEALQMSSIDREDFE